MCSSTGFEIDAALATADLHGLLDVAERALRRAKTLPLGGAVDDVALTQAVQRLEAVSRVAESHKCAVVGEIEQRHAARGQSAASTEDLLTRVLHLTPGEAKARTELAAGLKQLPDTAAAFADGRVGLSQAAVAVKKAAEVAGRDDAEVLLATIDRTASTVGQTTNRTRLAREIDTAVAKTGVDVLAERERRAFQDRKLQWSVRDGMDVLTAHLDPIGAATVRGMLDALSDKTSERDSRTFVQRQADALVDLATLAHTARNIAKTTMPPSKVLLITTPDALHGLPGAEPATIDGHGPVSPELARQLCCDSAVTPVVTGRNGEVLDVGREERLPTTKQRNAVIARDKTCVGCDAPVSRCQIHHIKWWGKGGAT
ncbi:MAG TPA: DUF222 domain-containing protein, partial [Egibacteraceae bacterium]|nr:DUF222 domain-containing protein [Egibacteraceae bacterium]